MARLINQLTETKIRAFTEIGFHPDGAGLYLQITSRRKRQVIGALSRQIRSPSASTHMATHAARYRRRISGRFCVSQRANGGAKPPNRQGS